ncbi:DUF4878 domain-containing protein [Aureibaculum sp. A20]|uniref:DUF4878 domain-containing protein n=1 Tax=Aureibaculum flavum TaxID=2795986 RepID=A0ABS0WLG8_9FLAO|nr:DUF4878 domain-containing protein [Aureibaculum flavum]MBJ2172789.1 DUF4878 domain-containing protein [Aureibaculum flavum]
MKKIISISFLFLLIACSSSGPGNATKNFLENMAHGKLEEAKKYATEPTGKMLDFAMSLGSNTSIEPDLEVEIIKDSIVGKKAWVTFIAHVGEGKIEKEETIELVELDGKWLVHMDTKK